MTASLLLALALLAPATVASPTANAITQDEIFLIVLDEGGIGYSTPAGAIAAAHEVCSLLDRGYTPDEVGYNVWINTDLDVGQAGYFVGASIGAYCPEYGDLIGV